MTEATDEQRALASAMGGEIVSKETITEPAVETTTTSTETPAADPPANTSTEPVNTETPDPGTTPAQTETPKSDPPKTEPARVEVRELSEQEIWNKALTGTRFKTKEEFEQFARDAIIPKSDLVRKLNDFDKDPELLIKVNKLDVEKLDDKESIIQRIMLEKGRSREQAELLFQDDYEVALKTPGAEDHTYTENQIRAAQLRMQDKAEEDKKWLTQWKTDVTATGISPEQQALQAKEQQDLADRIQAYSQGINSAIDSNDKLNFSFKITTPDNKEVDESFTFGVSEDARKTAKDILSDPHTLRDKFWARYGTGEKAYDKLAEAIYIIENRNEIIAKIASHAYGKGYESLTREVKPGKIDASETGASAAPTTKTREDVLIEYFKENQ